MTRKQKIFLVTALTVPELVLIAVAVVRANRFPIPFSNEPTTFTGSVLADNGDSTKQSPLAGVSVAAEAGGRVALAKSDPSGFFRVTLKPGVKKDEAVVLTFEDPNYKTLQMMASVPVNQLYIARMQLHQARMVKERNGAVGPAKVVEIRNIRVRYSFKDESIVGVGSLAKQFSAPNRGNVPCGGVKPCSPDGKWKATRTALSLDADEGNEFGNVRVSCIAGPCAFTRAEPDHFTQPQRRITVSVLNWSDTADFLVEADVARTMVTDAVRVSYPFIVGEAMNFALPPSSKGPSLEADLGGEHVVFPLGPALILSWSSCSVEVSANGDKLYRCQAKPGFRLQG